MATQLPAVGAKDGSYLTMRSDEGLLLAGVILVSVCSRMSLYLRPAQRLRFLSDDSHPLTTSGDTDSQSAR